MKKKKTLLSAIALRGIILWQHNFSGLKATSINTITKTSITITTTTTTTGELATSIFSSFEISSLNILGTQLALSTESVKKSNGCSGDSFGKIPVMSPQDFMQSVFMVHWAVQQGGETGPGWELAQHIEQTLPELEKPSLNSYSDKIHQGLFCHDQVNSGKFLAFFNLLRNLHMFLDIMEPRAKKTIHQV